MPTRLVQGADGPANRGIVPGRNDGALGFQPYLDKVDFQYSAGEKMEYRASGPKLAPTTKGE
jgi:hypothetical protein